MENIMKRFMYIVQAYELDNTDVYFLSKFARIALDQRCTDMAGTVFNRVNFLFLFNFCNR